MQSRFALFGRIAVALACLLSVAPSWAQDWPAKPIRMIIPFTPGGVSDVMGRFWAQKLSQALGTQVVAENRPGAGTTIAAGVIARAEPDGYTLYFADVTTHAINATLYSRLAFDSVEDFTPVALVAAAPLVFLVSEQFPAKTMKDFIKEAKAAPGKYNYASSGNGTILHLSAELLKRQTGMDLMHIPYKGSADAVLSTLNGQTTATFSTLPPALPQIQAHKLRALAVTSKDRNTALPDVPALDELVPGFEIILYSGILAPARLPPEIAERINQVVSKVLKEPETRKFYTELGAAPVDMSPARFKEHLRKQVATLGELVKQSGAKAD